ncbi:MAG: hypothetical protein N2596_01795, partial [Syntrophorhabdaceae bacterium]|nr:hypothetical protein [Syntrophorhabdaceae bacterium]
NMLSYIEPQKVESIVATFLKIINEKPGSIKGVIIDEGFWYDIGTLDAFFKIKECFKDFNE